MSKEKKGIHMHENQEKERKKAIRARVLFNAYGIG